MSEYIITDEQLQKDHEQFYEAGQRNRQVWTARVYHGQEIVRCRDCKHFTPKGTHKFENGKVNEDYCDYVRGWMLQITPDGFCAWGERRTDDN